MIKYICFSSKKKDKNANISVDSALYFVKSLGKQYMYKNTYPLAKYCLYAENNSETELLTFDTFEQARMLCNVLNKLYDTNFVVKDIFVKGDDLTKDPALLNNEPVLSNTEIYKKAVKRYQKQGILDPTSIIVALEKEIDYYRATLEKYNEMLGI